MVVSAGFSVAFKEAYAIIFYLYVYKGIAASCIGCYLCIRKKYIIGVGVLILAY
jgi:hypothetical protein